MLLPAEMYSSSGQIFWREEFVWKLLGKNIGKFLLMI
jgi:hypothetical protein